MNLVDVVIISGAGSGIGHAVAIELGKSGIPILCISKSTNAENTAREIQETGGIAESLILDIGDYNKAEKVLTEWVRNSNHKKIGLVLAAGILGPKGPLTECLLNEWDKCHKVNVLGNLAVLKGTMFRMLENRFGRIVTFAGGGSAYAFPIFPAYSATKTAMVRITENINEDLANKGDFAIVCLAPGAVETDMLKSVRSAGAEVKTTVDLKEPVFFIKDFINAKSCGFSGRFVHVRNNWKNYLNSDQKISNELQWKLRRAE